jgi:outer membrane protein assembly factor BamD (BamD/ComL family)
MKYKIIFLLVSITLVLSGCSGNNAEELFETAKLEELQNAREHAIELYQEIIDKYPDSEFAKKAKERLTVLQKPK